MNGSDGSPEYAITALGFEDNVVVAYDDQAFLGLKPGQHWGRIKGKVCATVQTEVSWLMWEAVTADGAAYKYPDAGFTEPMKGPLFPEFTAPVPRGQCRTGFVYVAIDKNAKIDVVTFTGSGAPVVTWKVA